MKRSAILLVCTFFFGTFLFGQSADTIIYDFRDGVIIAAGQSDDGKLLLGGNFNHHGTTYGLDMKVDSKIKIAVDGSCTVQFLGSKHSSLSMSGETSDGSALEPAEQSSKVINDLSDTYEFSYIGGADTLIFTAIGDGSDVYLPLVKVISSTLNYDFRDGTIIAAGQSSDGSLKLNGNYNHHGTTYGLDMKVDSEIKLAVSGSCVVRFLGSKHSSLSMSGKTSGGTSLDPAEQSTKVTNDLSDTYEFSYNGSADTLIFTAKGDGSDVYLPLVQIIPSDPVTGYDFRDGTIIANGQSDDTKLMLGGNYGHHGTSYGLNMKADATIKIAVDGSCKVSFLGSKHSSLSMSGETSDGTALEPAEQSTKVTNDLSDTYEFIYYGFEDTLLFTATGSGSDVYLPSLNVIPLDPPIAYDFRDGTIIAAGQSADGSLQLGGNYNHHGTTYGMDMKVDSKIKIAVNGSCMLRFLGSKHSSLSMSGETSDGTALDPSVQSTKVVNDLSDKFEFAYSGSADTLIFTATGSGSDVYLPLIEVIPGAVKIREWKQKSGTLVINGDSINITTGSASGESAVVTASKGKVISATDKEASLSIDLAGQELSSFTPVLSGDIDSTAVEGSTINIYFSDDSTDPKTYKLKINDSSLVTEAEPGKTYTYSFADGSEMPQNTEIKYTTFITNDGLVELSNGGGKEFWYHDATHGVVIYDKNSIHITVAGNATITFITCTYSADESVFNLLDGEGNPLGTIAAENNGGDDAHAVSYSYTGPAGVISAHLVSGGSVYIHGLVVENAAIIEPSSGKIDVWDFGAEQLDTSIYKNRLNEEIINSWYDESITTGSSGNVLPGFTAGVLSWIGGHNDRLRTTNTKLTRYDENISKGKDLYTGRVYVNSASNTGRFMSLTLSEDDEVTVIGLSQNGSGRLNFEYVADPEVQTDQLPLGPEVDTLVFVAKNAGTYHIFDDQDKPSYFRIYRKDAARATVSGTVDESEAPGIPEGYAIVFTNNEGKKWTSVVSENAYSVDLPTGFSYSLSLSNANGYVISSNTELEVNDTTTTFNISIIRVELYTVTGTITGLGMHLSNLSLAFSPDSAANKIFVPEPVINIEDSSYAVELEPNCEYTISANGINDFYLPEDKITIEAGDTTIDLDFMAKPVYNVTFITEGLTEEQKAKLNLTFTNLHEEGYTYGFESIDQVKLRNGTYAILSDGLDQYPVEMGLTSNLTIADEATSKTLSFKAVNNWPFDDKVIENGTPNYKGLLFTGNVYNEMAKGHLSAKPEASIQVPVNPGDKVNIAFYYSADFTIEGTDTYTTSSGSTSKLEFAEYAYTGTEKGYITITINSGAGTTYFTNISTGASVEYKAKLYVGIDKEFKTLNEALNAIDKMVRNENERVTVMIDPGNYEEMLVINAANITLKNAANTPGIGIKNEGVHIDDNAVRITSYYGHGYDYFSMDNNQKWNADILRVNKENGYYSYKNKGAGTSNGSYWNATVVVNASGFEAYDIIFENSFNQYISMKESQDKVVMWESGGKGERPVDYGNTSVQDRSFVERAAAIAFTGSADKAILYKCRVIGRQDSFYGSSGIRTVIYKGAMMGAVDYIFGGMTAVFYKSDLVMNTSDASSDASYITAAQQSSGRGYLMYECFIKSTQPGIETASQHKAKPGYFGRPWQATTSEVVFYNTSIGISDYPGSEGKSLIAPEGWKSSLGGESTKMYEFGTVEESGENNQSDRASWSTVLSEPKLNDGTEITTFNFTKGNDGWDPLPDLIAMDPSTSVYQFGFESNVNIYSSGNRIYLKNVQAHTWVSIYSISGSKVKMFETDVDTDFNFKSGIWIIKTQSIEGSKTEKVFVK